MKRRQFLRNMIGTAALIWGTSFPLPRLREPEISFDPGGEEQAAFYAVVIEGTPDEPKFRVVGPWKDYTKPSA